MTRQLLFLSLIFALSLLGNSQTRAGIIIDDFSALATAPSFGTSGTSVQAGGDLTNAFVSVAGANSTPGVGYEFTPSTSPPPVITYDFRDAGGSDISFSAAGGGNNASTLLLPIAASPAFFANWDMEIFFRNVSGTQESVYSGGLITRFDDVTNTTAVSLADAHEIEFRFTYTGDLTDSADGTFGGTSAFEAIPEPTSALLFSSITVGLLVPRRRKR